MHIIDDNISSIMYVPNILWSDRQNGPVIPLGTFVLSTQAEDPCFPLVGVAVTEPQFTLAWGLPFL